MTLHRTLNGFFASPRAPKRKAGSYIAIRGEVRAPVTKRGKLWTVTIAGETISNSLLGDLKSQLADMGYDVLAARP